MSSTRLTPCSSCARHVRIDQPVCPFCGAVVALAEASPNRSSIDGGGSLRLGRAARMAVGAAIASSVTVVAACAGGGDPTTDGGTTSSGGSTSSSSGSTSSSSSGGSTTSSSSGGRDATVADTNPPPDDGSIAKPYGAPPADGLFMLV